MSYLFDDYALDLERRELRRGGMPIPVEPQVFDLIAYLISMRERVVTKDDLLEGVWGGRIVSESTLSSRINAARTAIGDNGEDQRLIKTLPRKGYRFVGQVREGEEAVVATVPNPEMAPGVSALPAAEPPVSSAIELNAGNIARRDHSGDLRSYIEEYRPVGRLRRPVALAATAGFAVVATILIFVLWPGSDGRPPVSLSGPMFDVTAVPLITDADRISLATYAARPDAKALAISRGLMVIADGAPDVERARSEALRRCEARAPTKSSCRIYAAGIEVVWSTASLPLPAEGDLRFEQTSERVVGKDIPLVSLANQSRVGETYIPSKGHKAIGLTTGGLLYVLRRPTRAEAIRLTVEHCADYWQRPCLLLAIDDFLTVQVPKTKALARIFLPSTEAELPIEHRERIATIYRGAEWRAVARGGSGGWYAVAGASSEATAIEAAVKSCEQAETGCRPYAIGNFRIAEN